MTPKPNAPVIYYATGKLMTSTDGVTFSEMADIKEANEVGLRTYFPDLHFDFYGLETWAGVTFYLHGCAVPFTLCFDVWDEDAAPPVFLRTETRDMGPSALTATVSLAANEGIRRTYGRRRF